MPRVCTASIVDWLRRREVPRSVEYFGTRLIHPDRIVPAGCDGDAVDTAVAAATKMNGERTVRVRPGGNVVVAVHTPLIGFQIAVGVVDRDGPERIHRHVFDRDRVGGAAVIFLNTTEDVKGRALRQSPPSRRPRRQDNPPAGPLPCARRRTWCQSREPPDR